MNHKSEIFHFTDSFGITLTIPARKYSLEIDDLISRVGKTHLLGEFAETDLPQLLEIEEAVFGRIQWNDDNLSEAMKVFQYFQSIQLECITEAMSIRKKNKCFRWKDSDNDFKFDPSEYLGGEELKHYLIQELCNKDPETYRFAMTNFCPCEFTAFQAMYLTEQIKGIQQHKHFMDKIKK